MSEQQLDLEMWKQRVEAYEKSGLSKAQFCREHQLSAPTFWYYYRKFNPIKAKPQETPSGFVAVKSASIPSSSDLSLHFANGLKICVPNNMVTKELVRLLEVIRTC